MHLIGAEGIDYESFKNPPIVEALIDIHVAYGEKPDIEKLALVQTQVEEQFPRKTEKLSFEAGFRMSPEDGPASTFTTERQGFQFHSDDGAKLFQARIDGFTLNILPPYVGWEAMIAEARSLWELYCQTMDPQTVTRLAIRYINKIDLPMPVYDLRTYLTSFPVVAGNPPGSNSDFLMRVVLPFGESNRVATLTELTQVPPADSSVLPLIFDLEVRVEMPFAPADNLIWEEFAELRAIRNRVFFSSITEETRKLFR